MQSRQEYNEITGHCFRTTRGPFVADIVAKVFFGRSTKVLKTADALRARRLEGPHRFIPKRPPTFVLASESIAAARVSKNQLSRDFRRHSIFDFCNNIGTFRTWSI
jgi:hypothetical protein